MQSVFTSMSPPLILQENGRALGRGDAAHANRAHRAKILALRQWLDNAQKNSGALSRSGYVTGVELEAELSQIRTNITHDGAPNWLTGVPDVDAALPVGGLSREGVHEFSGATHADTVAASGYLFSLLKTLAKSSSCSVSRRPILWCQTARMQREFGSIYGAGLEAFGFKPQHFVFIQAAKNNDVLWALEEGAKSQSLLAVIGDIDTVSFTHSRRLKLAAAAGKTPVFLTLPNHDNAPRASETHWRVSARPGKSSTFLPTVPCNSFWDVALTRCRGGRRGRFSVEWNYETHRLALAEQLSPRSLVPKPQKTQTRDQPEHKLQYLYG